MGPEGSRSSQIRSVWEVFSEWGARKKVVSYVCAMQGIYFPFGEPVGEANACIFRVAWNFFPIEEPEGR